MDSEKVYSFSVTRQPGGIEARSTSLFFGSLPGQRTEKKGETAEASGEGTLVRWANGEYPFDCHGTGHGALFSQ